MSFSGKGKINEECMSKQALQSPSSTVGFAKIFAKVSFHMTIGDTLSVLKSTAGRAVKQDRFVKWPRFICLSSKEERVTSRNGACTSDHALKLTTYLKPDSKLVDY